MKAQFVHGSPLMTDHTPAGNVAVGQVVIIGARPYVAHKDIAISTLGALASFGGVYDLEKDDTAGPNILLGDEIYWITSTELATNVALGNVHFGYAVAAAGASATPVRVVHLPKGEVGA